MVSFSLTRRAQVTCGRCGALVAAARFEAHDTLWCEGLADAGGGA